MKNVLGALALLLALLSTPLDAARETAEHKSTKKTSQSQKRKRQGIKEKKGKKPRKTAKKESTTRSHKKAAVPARTTNVERAIVGDDKFIGMYRGKAIYLGPRGGQYYITDSYNKEYLEDDQKLPV